MTRTAHGASLHLSQGLCLSQLWRCGERLVGFHLSEAGRNLTSLPSIALVGSKKTCSYRALQCQIIQRALHDRAFRTRSKLVKERFSRRRIFVADFGYVLQQKRHGSILTETCSPKNRVSFVSNWTQGKRLQHGHTKESQTACKRCKSSVLVGWCDQTTLFPFRFLCILHNVGKVCTATDE